MFDKVTKSVRVLSAAAVERANSGHPGMPLGMADVGVVLYKNFLKVSNEKPDWINRDRFVLSAGHGSMLLYSLLHLNRFDISIDDLKNFRQLHAKTAGHPEVDNSIGIDTTTGPLGQGFANGVGFAVAERYLSSIFGDDVIDHYTYGIVSDGDLMEGISFEAAELAGVWKLGKLIYLFDNNNISIDGKVDKVSVTNQKEKFISLGWDVTEIDGHNEKEIIKALEKAKKIEDKPSLIIANSTIGKYSPNKENTSGVHGSPLGNEEMEQFLENIDWEGDLFVHDEEIYDYFLEKRNADNIVLRNWEDNLKKKYSEDPSFKEKWDLFLSGELSNLDIDSNKVQATRIAGSKILEEIGKNSNHIIGGSADLAASTKQIIDSDYFSSDNYKGRSIEFGIREHAMAAITNGITLHSNLIGYASTFLVFSDYMRPSIRLAALMDINSVFIFTHDSIYLGEDGPTHQPVEHLMSLRLIPNVDVIRPANSIEMKFAYQYAFSNTNNPKIVSLTRQDLEYLDYQINYEDFLKGGFVVSDGDDFTIVASGSELELAFKIKAALVEYSIRIVSVPILNKLLHLKKDEIKKLLKNNNIFPIELGRSIGWENYIGKVTKSFSVNTFGESAPIENLENEFNFDVSSITKEIIKYLN